MKITSPYLQKVALVCNITAGKGKSAAILKKLVQKLTDISIPHIVFTESWPKNFEGFTSVWLVGGDGTLNYFINLYPQLTIPIALFKGGSGNDFAWKLYGNKSVDEYFEMVLQSEARKVDAGICNNKYFVNGVGIGFDGEVVQAMGGKRIFPGHLGYLLTVLKKIFLYGEPEMMITMGDRNRSGKIFMITVANGSRFGGGFLVAPQAIIDDGELDIVIINQIARLKRFSYLPRVEAGKHLELEFIEVLRKKKIHVQSSFMLNAHLDGELMVSNQFEIAIIPQSLSFIY